MKKITLEEHYGNQDLEAIRKSWYARTGFPSSTSPVPGLAERLRDIEEFRLPEMDAHEIAVQVLSITTPGVQWMEAAAAAEIQAKRFNDTLAEIVRKHPTRFAAFATLPLQNPDAAARELERTVTQLGFKGAMIHGHTNGAYLDEEPFSVLWETAQGLNVPLYLHPTDPIPDQIKIYHGREDLLGPVWNWGVETGTHALRIVVGGVFDRFPGAILILGHLGEMLPYFLPRLNKRWELSADPKEKAPQRAPSEYFLKNIFITTTGVLSQPSLLCAVLSLGVDRVLFSVDYPYESTADAAAFIEAVPLNAQDREKICYQNAAALLGLD